MGRISGFKNWRNLGYSTVTVNSAGVALADTARPSACNAAFITITANAASTAGIPVVKYTVPLEMTAGVFTTAPAPGTGLPVWNGGILALWAGQLDARLISLDGREHTASINWVYVQ